MGLGQFVKSLYRSHIGSDNIRYATYPIGAPIAMVSDGVVGAWAWAPYVQIMAAAGIPDPCWLAGMEVYTGVVETIMADLEIAVGAGAAEVTRAIVGLSTNIPTAVGIGVITPLWLPEWIRLPGAPRVAGRIRKSTAASAAGFSMKIIVATAVGT